MKLRNLRNPNESGIAYGMSRDRALSDFAGGELFDLLVEHGPMSERRAAQMTQSLASALRYCHA